MQEGEALSAPERRSGAGGHKALAGPLGPAGRLSLVSLFWLFCSAVFSACLNAVFSGQSGNKGGTKAGTLGGIDYQGGKHNLPRFSYLPVFCSGLPYSLESGAWGQRLERLLHRKNLGFALTSPESTASEALKTPLSVFMDVTHGRGTSDS